MINSAALSTNHFKIVFCDPLAYAKLLLNRNTLHVSQSLRIETFSTNIVEVTETERVFYKIKMTVTTDS